MEARPQKCDRAKGGLFRVGTPFGDGAHFALPIWRIVALGQLVTARMPAQPHQVQQAHTRRLLLSSLFAPRAVIPLLSGGGAAQFGLVACDQGFGNHRVKHTTFSLSTKRPRQGHQQNQCLHEDSLTFLIGFVKGFEGE
jgi:uncharacterized membrane protein